MTARSKPDLSDWYSFEQVCEALKISPATLKRQVAKDQWQTRKREREGKKPETVFPPHEVEQRIPGPTTELVRREETAIGSPLAQSAHEPMAETMALTTLTEADLLIVGQIVQDILGAAPVNAPKLWVMLREASAITGISVRALKRLAKSGDVQAIFDNAFKLRRDGLETLDVSSLLVAKPAKKRGKR